MRVLVIEDDAALRALLAFHLGHADCEVDTCADGVDGLDYMLQAAHDLVVLDRMLPGLDGVSALRAARAHGVKTPVLMLTALDAVDDRVDGLDAGADDYLTKPFETKELLARVRALVRRPASLNTEEPLRYGDLCVDATRLTLEGPGGHVNLTKREMQLFEALMGAQGSTVARETLFVRVWGVDAFVEDGNLDCYIHFLRNRLKEVKSRARVRAVRGVGYRMEAP